MATSSRMLYRVETDAPALTLKDIQWNSIQHIITIGEMQIALTPAEYRLLYPLRLGLATSFDQLAYEIYGYDFDERIRSMIDKHIDRLRGKLRGSGVYVYCIVGYGYILLPVPQAKGQALRVVR
jgi:DNA-binding response OmpR family regulator